MIDSTTPATTCPCLAAPGATRLRGPWLPPLSPFGPRRLASTSHGHAATRAMESIIWLSQLAPACCQGGEMSDRELEDLRRHGFGVAYRMLGSVAEAEDVVQEALVRLTRQEEPIDEPAAWITTVVTRLSINVLRSARVRRESYVGPWLPEPLLEDPEPGPASRAELADSLSLAMLVLLERLTPAERAAYLLREVFGYGYAEVADIIERTEANSRQLVTRARKHVEAGRPRFDADEAARDA